MNIKVTLFALMIASISALHSTVEEFKGTLQQFEARLHQGKPVVVKFYQPWCPACKKFADTFKNVSNEFPGVLFLAVHGDANPEVTQHYNITQIPTLKYFDAQGKMQSEKAGAPSAAALRENIQKIQ